MKRDLAYLRRIAALEAVIGIALIVMAVESVW